jgi:DNA-directed RNA polymerase beta subunit
MSGRQIVEFDFNFSNVENNKLVFLKEFSSINDEKKLIGKAYKNMNSDHFNYVTYDMDGSIIDEKKIPNKNINIFIIEKQQKMKNRILGKEDTSRLHKKISYFNLEILNYKLPLVVYLGYVYGGMLNLLDSWKIKYSVYDKKDNGAKYIFEWSKRNNGNYLNIYTDSIKDEFLLNGLKDMKSFETDDYNNPQVFEDFIVKKFNQMAPIKITTSKIKMIDPLTEEYLIQHRLPTSFVDLIRDTAIPMLLSSPVGNMKNSKNARLRMGEAVGDIVYQQLMMGIERYKTIKSKGFKDTKLEVHPHYVSQTILSQGLTQLTKTVNPIEEISLSNKLTKAGLGIDGRRISLDVRDINNSYFGVYAPTFSNEYKNIGIVFGLSAGLNFENRFGNVVAKDINSKDIKGHDILAINELTTPFLNKNNTNRLIMGNQQYTQFMELENPDIPLVQTGYEAYIPQLVSKRFAKKVKEDGIVTKVIPEKSIEVQYKSGKKDIISLATNIARTKRGVFIPKVYKLMVSEGQRVKKDQLVAATTSLKNGLLTHSKNIWIAEASYLGGNYEDGWVVSESIVEKYKTLEYVKVTVPVFDDIKVEKFVSELNKETKNGDPLVVFNTKSDNFVKKADTFQYDYLDNDDNDVYAQDGSNDDSEDILVGMKVNKDGKVYYTSPGGKIKNIVIKINSKKIDHSVLIEYNKMIDNVKKHIDDCGSLYDKNSESYSDCTSSNSQLEMMKVGGHKLNGEEINGAIIEYYIERYSVVGNGTKMTVGNGFGAKGTIQQILPNDETPVSEITEKKIEILQSPLGIPKRKNIGLVMTIMSGKLAYMFNYFVKTKWNTHQIRENVKTFYGYLDKTEDRKIYKNMVKNITDMNDKVLADRVKAMEPLEKPLFPVIVPTFQNDITVHDLEKVAKEFDIPFNERLRYKHKGRMYVTDEPVLVGVISVLLLEHLVQHMSSLRSSAGVYDHVTGQPKSGSKEGKGALKIGEYDMASLKAVLGDKTGLTNELFGMKSDNSEGRREMVNQIIKEGKVISQDSYKKLMVEGDVGQSEKLIKTTFLATGHSVKEC